MRDKIIEQSIIGLQKEGLRFSVDTIARELNISKKTVYKYFPTKEDMAIAVYEKFYNEIDEKMSESVLRGGDTFSEMLFLYYRFCCMVRKDLFNKFSLNNAIRDLALTKHGMIREKFQNTLPSEGRKTNMFVIDSVLENLNGAPLTAELTEKLERLL